MSSVAVLGRTRAQPAFGAHHARNFRGAHFVTDASGQRYADRLTKGLATVEVVRFEENPNPRPGELWTEAVASICESFGGGHE